MLDLRQMKLQFKVALPTHIPMRYVFSVVGVLFALQLAEGTQIYTSLAYCAFVVVIADAFNTCGGLVYPSGGYIFFTGFLSLILGGLVKTAFGESLDSNLLNAQKSILVYLVGACSLWVAAKINVRIRRKKPLLLPLQIHDHFEQAVIGAAVFGQFGGFLFPFAYRSTFNQVNNFLPLAVMLAVYGTTRKTGGRRSFSIQALFLWTWFTLFWGIFAFSKQGMFTASVAWALGALVAGYWLTMKRLIFIIVFAVTLSTFLTPISQLGRNYKEDPNSRDIALDMLYHPLRTRERYEEAQAEQKRMAGLYHWFDESHGLLDRLTMMPLDDALIRLTDQGHSETILPIQTYALNMIPRYLVGTKTVFHWGNTYAHELGLLAHDDTTTGVSFSPFADAYHCVQWLGVTVISTPLFLMMFLIADSLTGSTKDTFWACLYLLVFSHSAAEGGMNTPFAASSIYVFTVVVAAVLIKYVLPLVGGMLIPVRRTILPLSADPVPRPAPVLRSGPRTIEEKL